MTQIIAPEKKGVEVADILHKHIDDYGNEYPLWPEHRKIVSDLLNCRTAHLGGISSAAIPVARYILCIIPAVIGTAQNASTCHEKDGLRKEKTKSYPPVTFTSSLRCRMS